MPQINTVFTNFLNVPPVQNWQTKPQQTPKIEAKKLPWLKDRTIAAALSELDNISFDKKDLAYLKAMGVNPPYKSGSGAVDFIKNSNVRIAFAKTSSKHIHAQYDYEKNTIYINDLYKNSQDFPVILAIAEAILHEAGHAKDNDGDSSIQEELDFLGMNAIAHRAFLKKYGDIFNESDELIVKDGVNVYAELFFEPDPDKKKLVERMKKKYGYLQQGDALHPASKLARKIKGFDFTAFSAG